MPKTFDSDTYSKAKKGFPYGRTEKVCGTCTWHWPNAEDWVCVNSDSDYCSDWTDYCDTCDNWEGR